MAFTAEQRAKAAQTRKANAEQRRLQKQTHAKGAAGTTGVREYRDQIAPPPASPSAEYTGEFDWNKSSIPEITDRLNQMKREYERVSQIVLSRTSRVAVSYLCWCATDEAKGKIPSSVSGQCRKSIKDGTWVHRNDGHTFPDGHRGTAVCCSMLCYTVYQQHRPVGGLSRH